MPEIQFAPVRACLHFTMVVASRGAPTSTASYLSVTPRLKNLPDRGCAAFSSNEGIFIGDGFCDQTPDFNSPECMFDGGDCCYDTVSSVICCIMSKVSPMD